MEKPSVKTLAEREGWDRMLASHPKRKRKTHMPRDRMLQFFAYGHLRDDLKEISRPFGDLAESLCVVLPSNPERTVMLRHLLEAKDCAVRAFLYKEPEAETADHERIKHSNSPEAQASAKRIADKPAG